MGTITLRPVLFYCWRGYTILAPWHAMFLFSPCITNVWTNEDIFMWHPVCFCNVFIFLDILWCILINKANYLVTEEMQKHIKLAYDDDKTKHGHKAKLHKVSENSCGYFDRTTNTNMIKYQSYRRPNCKGSLLNFQSHLRVWKQLFTVPLLSKSSLQECTPSVIQPADNHIN